jgi:hypothetical protein
LIGRDEKFTQLLALAEAFEGGKEVKAGVEIVDLCELAKAIKRVQVVTADIKLFECCYAAKSGAASDGAAINAKAFKVFELLQATERVAIEAVVVLELKDTQVACNVESLAYTAGEVVVGEAELC